MCLENKLWTVRGQIMEEKSLEIGMPFGWVRVTAGQVIGECEDWIIVSSFDWDR